MHKKSKTSVYKWSSSVKCVLENMGYGVVLCEVWSRHGVVLLHEPEIFCAISAKTGPELEILMLIHIPLLEITVFMLPLGGVLQYCYPHLHSWPTRVLPTLHLLAPIGFKMGQTRLWVLRIPWFWHIFTVANAWCTSPWFARARLWHYYLTSWDLESVSSVCMDVCMYVCMSVCHTFMWHTIARKVLYDD